MTRRWLGILCLVIGLAGMVISVLGAAGPLTFAFVLLLAGGPEAAGEQLKQADDAFSPLPFMAILSVVGLVMALIPVRRRTPASVVQDGEEEHEAVGQRLVSNGEE